MVMMTAIGVLLMWGGMTEATPVDLRRRGLTTADLTVYLPCGAGMPPRVPCGTTTRMQVPTPCVCVCVGGYFIIMARTRIDTLKSQLHHRHP
jgi:hypothetical protein